MNNSIERQLLPLKSLAFNILTTPNKESGLSCLQSACINGHVETVNVILSCSPDKLASAIALSLCKSSEKVTEISKIAEEITTLFQSESLLHLAARKGTVEHLRRLLDFDAHVDSVAPGLSGQTPLILAAKFNDEVVVEYLVKRGASLEKQDAMGFTPFHHAAIGGKIQNLLLLVEIGADVLKESYDQFSALHLSAKNGHTKVVGLLLDYGATVNTVNFLGATPLVLAVQKGHIETVKLLVKNGGDLNRFGNGWLPIHYAVAGQHTDVVKFLVESGANVLAATNELCSVLHLTCQLELVSFLVEKGAEVNARNVNGETPLHTAAKNGQSDTVSYLLNQGADINACDSSGSSALMHAVSCGHAAIAKVLIDRGFDEKRS